MKLLVCGSRAWSDRETIRHWIIRVFASQQEVPYRNHVLVHGAARGADDSDKTFGGFVPESDFDAAKVALDELHKRKIDLCDEVLVLNVDGYIGDSTRSEIEYAKAHGKDIRWLEEPS